MIAERIKFLREQNSLTQTQLAKKLSITRSSVNAWEMGISIPSTKYLVELADNFGVSTDFLLCRETSSTIDISSLSEKDIQLIYHLVNNLKNK